jgi:uncharacterized protein (TIGR03000 family)
MYSIALLMALTGGSEVADGHRHGGGCGGYEASCGCGGGGRRHHERHHGHRHHGDCGCCGNVAPVVSCGCCGAPSMAGPGPGYGPPPQGHEPIPAKPKEKPMGQASAPATIIVELPADASLKVDGQVTMSTSNVRVLLSPELPAGKVFQYTLTVQAVRDGKPVQVEQNVDVRAGEESRVSLNLPVASVAQR